jgi:hypothetical protein
MPARHAQLRLLDSVTSPLLFLLFPVDRMNPIWKESLRFGWRIVFFSGIPHPHLLGEPLPESPLFSFYSFLPNGDCLFLKFRPTQQFKKLSPPSRKGCFPGVQGPPACRFATSWSPPQLCDQPGLKHPSTNAKAPPHSRRGLAEPTDWL